MCVGAPLDAPKVFSALKESGGFAGDVSDKEILEAGKLLASTESIFSEPSGSSGLALLMRLIEEGSVDKSEKIVLVMTGAGLKDPKSALRILPSPPSVEPVLSEVNRFINYDYYKICAEVAESEVILFRKVPDEKTMEDVVRREFGIDLKNGDAKYAIELVKEFIEKEKPVSKNDLKLILEETLRRSRIKEKVLKIIDYTIDASKSKPPQGYVTVEYMGKEVTKRAIGVGPVDAIIKAALKAVEEGGIGVRLTNYEVEINTRGTDAAVDVKMTLEDNKNNKVIAMGTNPDIIVASVEAFEQGYNILHWKNGGGKKDERGKDDS